MAKKSNENKKSGVSKLPIGVKIISVLYYIGAGFSLLLGLILLFTGGKASEWLSSLEIFPGFFTVLFMVAGIFLIISAIIGFFIANGLSRLKNWARIAVMVFAVLGLINGLFTLPIGILNLLISGLILWYLGFNKDAKKAFK